MSATPPPRPARLAAAWDRFAGLTESIVATFTDDTPGSTTEGRAMLHYAPASTYARTGGAR